MRRILITGGAGFIGSNFVHYWSRRHPADRIVVLDALTYAGVRANLAGLTEGRGFRFVHGGIGDLERVSALLREERIELIVNFAAESHVDRSIHAPQTFVRTNVIDTHKLMMAAREAWPRNGPQRFHHISTDEVYGDLGAEDPPWDESSPYRPSSPYAASKAAADHLARAYHRTYALPLTISNCSNNFGPYQFPEKLIPLVILNTLAGRTIPIYGDGKQIRDWLYVDDHCHGIEQIIERGRDGETYNLAAGNQFDNLTLVRRCCALIDQFFQADPALSEHYPDAPPAAGEPAASLIAHVRDRPGHDSRYALNADKARDELGFSPGASFEECLRATVRWYLDNETWWRALTGGEFQEWLRRQYGDGDANGATDPAEEPPA